MDKLKSLVIFLRFSKGEATPTAQYQSFSEAARQLSMLPSAVSRAVARLEEDLGIRLLQRTTRSLTLTEDGTKYFDRSEKRSNIYTYYSSHPIESDYWIWCMGTENRMTLPIIRSRLPLHHNRSNLGNQFAWTW